MCPCNGLPRPPCRRNPAATVPFVHCTQPWLECVQIFKPINTESRQSMSVPVEQVARTLAQCTPLFFALGETPRQQILLLLTESESLNVGQLAERLPLSRPAISHHLKILRQAGLI